MKEEGMSSCGDPLLPPRSSSPPRSVTPSASSAGASSPALHANAGSTEWFGQGNNSRGGSLSRIGSQPMHGSFSTTADGSALGSSQPSCRPWERGDLLRRLSTFKPADWFGKPKVASSLACARRGWVNVGIDEIECESCGANLKSVASAASTHSQAYFGGEDFARRLDEGHKVACPWIGNCCAESLVQFPPTPPSALIGGYKDRCDGLIQFPVLPIVAASALEQISLSRGPEIDHLLAQSQFAGGESALKLEIMLGNENSREDAFFTYSRAQKLISLCGWEPRWLPNIQDCEENSAQSARNGYSIGPSKYHGPPRDAGRGNKAMSSTKKERGINLFSAKPRSLSRSPLLDCSLCGATVRIWDFLSVPRPSCFVPNSGDVAETSKKMALTRGVSAASGISGWVAADGMEKEQAGDIDETANDDGKSLNIGVDLNLTLSAGLSSSPLNLKVTSEQYRFVPRGRDMLIPATSEVGDASYESRGPTSRKRNLEEGGSTVDRPPVWIQPADSIEGTVVDRDGDEVNDGRQFSAGPSKRFRDSYVPEPHRYGKDSSVAGPSHSFGFDILADGHRAGFFDQEPEQMIANSTRASSVIAMDTIYNAADDDSMDSVDNCPGDFDDIHLPSTSGMKNTDLNETSELNYSNQAQQSNCPAIARSAAEMVVSSTNEEEVVNADTDTVQLRDGPSFGISGGSVGMGPSHEAEIHGADASINRTESIVGEVELIAEITDNQGQTGENAPDPGLMGDFIPEEMDREDRRDDSQELMSRSRADSGSKIVGSAKADSVDSGEKTSNRRATPRENSPHPSLSCNAVVFSGFEVSKEEVTQVVKDPASDECGYGESGFMVANGIGPPNGGSNYEAVEFDPLKHHNHFCPWVNGNVAAAGCSSSSGSGSSVGAMALCGWQLTLDALDSFQSLGQIPVQTVESESAASMYKDDHLGPSRKLLARNSFNKGHGRN